MVVVWMIVFITNIIIICLLFCTRERKYDEIHVQ